MGPGPGSSLSGGSSPTLGWWPQAALGTGQGAAGHHDGPETAQTAALTHGACPAARGPPSGARPRRWDPCGDRGSMEAGQGGSSPPKMQGEASPGGHPGYLRMTRGALPLSPQDKHPRDLVGGPRRAHCKWALNTEPGLLAGCPPTAGAARPAALPPGWA